MVWADIAPTKGMSQIRGLAWDERAVHEGLPDKLLSRKRLLELQALLNFGTIHVGDN